jgi:CBS domain-containing protein
MLYHESLTIADLIRHIGIEHERTCILEDSSGKLYGVVSQGDLLKAIWNGHELITPIDKVINPNPIFISNEITDLEKEALKIFSKHGILLIPVIDKTRKIQKIISIRKIMSEKYDS